MTKTSLGAKVHVLNSSCLLRTRKQYLNLTCVIGHRQEADEIYVAFEFIGEDKERVLWL